MKNKRKEKARKKERKKSTSAVSGVRPYLAYLLERRDEVVIAHNGQGVEHVDGL